MYPFFLHLHSIIRYILMFLLLYVLFVSLVKWLQHKPFTKTDNTASLLLFIFTNVQFLAGFVLYLFLSPWVSFSSSTMSDKMLRYWTVEHITIMIIAVAVISIGRSRSKKQQESAAKFKVLFYTSLIALALIVVGMAFSGRGIIGTY